MFGRQAGRRRPERILRIRRRAIIGRVDNAEARVMDRLPHPADRIDETLIRVEWPDPMGKYSAGPAAHATISRRRITRKLIPCPISGPAWRRRSGKFIPRVAISAINLRGAGEKKKKRERGDSAKREPINEFDSPREIEIEIEPASI